MLKPVRRMLRDLLGPTETLRYPEESLDSEHLEQLRGIPYLERPDKCISCGFCEKSCPNRAIEMKSMGDNRKNVPFIHVNMCMSCGLCVEVCPVEALAHSSVIAVVSGEREIIVDPGKKGLLEEKRRKGDMVWRLP